MLLRLIPLLLFVACGSLSAAPLRIAENGEPRVSVVVDQAALDLDLKQRNPDAELLMLRWAADDLGEYLSRITGGQVTVAAAPVEGRIPIHVGNAPEEVALGVSSEFGDAWALSITPARIALAGESSRAVYYAAARFLHDCGVRWYSPDSLGEIVPSKPDLTVETGHLEATPSFHTRGLWADRRWALRNGLGGPQMAQGHAFASFMSKFNVDEHPDYFPIINGKVVKYQANLSNPEVVKLFVDGLRERLRKGTNWAGNGVAIGPDDGALLDERPESIAMDSGRIDPFLQVRSGTDRFISFCNQVAGELEAEFPEAYFGFYVYSNHNLAPQTVKPHRLLFPIVAPITYNRFTSIGNPIAPTSPYLEEVIRAWVEVSPRIGCYLYNFNLADTAMPFTRTLAWRLTFPRLHQWGLRYATIESMDDNWHFQIPGNYILSRILWDVTTDVDALLDDFYPTFYGPAAAPMRRYNEVLENAYETTTAYAGSIWSIHRILHPDVMQALHAALADAEAAVVGQDPYAQRVRITRHSLTFADTWLAARAAFNEGRLADAAAQAAAFKANYDAGSAAYPRYIGKRAWGYFRGYFNAAFEEAGRLARESRIIGAFPDKWKGFIDKDGVGVADAFWHPDRDTSSWITLRTHTVSLDEQGFPFYRGAIWYRTTFELPEAERDTSQLRIWIGGIDDSARVWLNGQDLGSYGRGNFPPVDVDISAAVNREGTNTLAIMVTNHGITELGTGGIMRPVFLHAPYAEGEAPPDAIQQDRPRPLFGGDIE